MKAMAPGPRHEMRERGAIVDSRDSTSASSERKMSHPRQEKMLALGSAEVTHPCGGVLCVLPNRGLLYPRIMLDFRIHKPVSRE